MNRDFLHELFHKYEDYRKERKKRINAGDNNYSLIHSFLKPSDEVNLHSKFIYSMINPEGLHFQEYKYLKIFLDILNLELNYENVRVRREYRHIDLLIDDGESFIILENKVNAMDQNSQISKYIKTVSEISDKSDIVVVYLSRKGRKISKCSLGDYRLLSDENSDESYLVFGKNRIRFIPINYTDHISEWVNLSRNESNSENLVYAFEEYSLILDRLNHTNNLGVKVMEFSDYILSQDKGFISKYLEASVEIENNFYKIIAQLIMDRLNSIRGLEEKKIVNETEPFLQKTAESKRRMVEALTVESLINWFKRSPSNRDKYKDIGFCFKGKNNQKNIVLFALDYCYIAPYKNSFTDFQKQKDKYAVGGSNFRKIIKNPNKINSIFFEIEDRIMELMY